MSGLSRSRPTIAMIGQRGVPATSGGVERHVEELGARLVELGHEVVVYCRPTYSPDLHSSYRGMTLERVFTVESKHLEAIVHSGATTVAALRRRVDVVHYHAVGPGLLAPVPRWASRAKVVQTVHGLDQDRAKWGIGAAGVLNLGGWMSARVPDATVVVSRALRRHYLEKYGRETRYICNGVDVDVPAAVVQVPTPDTAGWVQAPGEATVRPDRGILDEVGVRAGEYVLFVGRLVPEKAPDLLIRTFAQLQRPDLKLLLVGGSSFTDAYVEELSRLAQRDVRVVMPGRIHAAPLAELYANAAAFVLPSDVEGMPLTLLEAAAAGIPLIASDIAPHVEMMGTDRPGRRLFRRGDSADLLRQLTAVLGDVAGEQAGSKAERDDVLDSYNWDSAARELSDLYRSLVGGGRVGSGLSRSRERRRAAVH